MKSSRFVTFNEDEGLTLEQMCVGELYHSDMYKGKGFTLGDEYVDVLVNTDLVNKTTRYIIVRGLVVSPRVSQFQGKQPFVITEIIGSGVTQEVVSQYTSNKDLILSTI